MYKAAYKCYSFTHTVLLVSNVLKTQRYQVLVTVMISGDIFGLGCTDRTLGGMHVLR